MNTIWTLLAAAVAAVLAGSIVIPSAEASSIVTCEQRFSQVEWDLVSDGDVAVYTSGVNDAMSERFGNESALATGWINDDIGPFEVVVCLIGEEAAIVGDQFATGSIGFHARSDLKERYVLVETQRPGLVGPAVTYALAQQALWQNGGNEAFPEPIASVIGQWYRARFLERLDVYHYQMMMGNFFDTDAVIDWTEGSQEPIQNWNPEGNFRAIGDFVEFAVGERGTGILLETDGSVWMEIEGEWRAALRADLTGRDTPTTDWLLGVAIAASILLVALAAIGFGLYSKHRRRERAATAPPVPGFFSDN